MGSRIKILPWWFAFAGLVPFGCGPEGGQLALKLTIAQQALGYDPRGVPAPGKGQPPPDIDAFRICIQDGKGKSLVCKDFTDLTVTKVHIGEIPAGTDRMVSFQGYHVDTTTRARDVLWCGRAVNVNIKKDNVTPVAMLISHCSDVTEVPELLSEGRVFHSASLLPDGTILFLGGFTTTEESTDCSQPCTAMTATASAEIYDPATGSFHTSNGGLTHARGLHASMTLSDGRVLVAGGCEKVTLQSTFSDAKQPGSPLHCLVPGQAATTAEVFDPKGGTSEVVEIPPAALSGFLALPKDRLLLLGGENETGQALLQGVLIDRSTNPANVTTLDSLLQTKRVLPLVTTFSEPGTEPVEALIFGGTGAVGINDAGIYAERLVVGANQVFTLIPTFVTMNPADGFPVMHAGAAALLPGRVLVEGGVFPSRFRSQDLPFTPIPLRDSAVVDLRLDRLTRLEAAKQLAVARAFHSCTTVSPGHIAIAGGFTDLAPGTLVRFRPTGTIEWWDDSGQAFSSFWVRSTPVSLVHARAGHSATLLPDGTALFVGGLGGAGLEKSAEVFNPFPTTLGDGGLVIPATSP